MKQDILCPSCDSSNTVPFHGVDDLYECLDCGDMFEDDSFLLRKIRQKRQISTKKDNE